MIKLGITGTIGSGKSIVCEVLRNLNIPVYNADFHAKISMNSNENIIEKLISKFGNEIYTNKKINKNYVSNLIFQSEKNRKEINSIVHPIVIENFISWSENQNSDTIALESALLFEANLKKIIDYSILVKTSTDLQIKRICKRDNKTQEEALKIIKIQEKQFQNNKINFIIQNNEIDSIIEQTIFILRKIRKLHTNNTYFL
jgi:dephospho-CoA kinase